MATITSPPSRNRTSKKTAANKGTQTVIWAQIINASSVNYLALFALIVLTIQAVFVAILKLAPAAMRAGVINTMAALLAFIILSVTVLAVLTSRRNKTSDVIEKERLIQQNQELVIDAEKPPLSYGELTRELTQLRSVLYQAPRYSTPTYYLDKHLSVIHWNVAFELIFRPILPRIRRRHVNYLIAELSNHDAVFDHAREFTQRVKEGQLPLVDIEPLIYNSENYGMVEFEKVATQLTDADGALKAWAVSLFLKNIDWEMYRPDLLQRLRDDKLWSIYAVSYDVIRLISRFIVSSLTK